MCVWSLQLLDDCKQSSQWKTVVRNVQLARKHLGCVSIGVQHAWSFSFWVARWRLSMGDVHTSAEPLRCLARTVSNTNNIILVNSDQLKVDNKPEDKHTCN